jgi:tetratricopeptide (TPR) repeat protein
MARGWQCHQSGNLEQAERIYRDVLHIEPGNADASYLLGVVCQTLGRIDEALECYRRALAQKPDYAEVHNNLGVIYSTQGKLAEAIVSYQRAIQCKPDYAEAHNNLGLDLAQQGHLDEAIASYRQTVRLRPSYAEAYENLRRAEAARQGQPPSEVAQVSRAAANIAIERNNQGIELWRQGRLDEALEHFQSALCLWPSYPEAYNNLGLVLVDRGMLDEGAACYQQALRFRPDFAEAHNNLGIARGRQGRIEEAADRHREAVRLRPDYAAAHNNLAVVLEKQHRLDEAVFHCQKALELSPDLAAAHNNLGIMYDRLGRMDDAAASYRQALKLQPDYADALNNLGTVHRDRLEFDDAERCYQRALQIRPDYPDAHLNRALIALQHGDFANGWREYEWRWQRSELVPRTFRQPRWDGAPLDGRTILLHAEQGLGDALQFIRYAPQVKERGGRVLVECQPAVRELLATCSAVEQVLVQGQPLPTFDVQASLMSLPALFETTLTNMPADVPYLAADPSLVEHWRQELSRVGGFKIGIVWQGSPAHRGDKHRSVPLTQFAPLAGVKGVHLLSLQVGAGTAQLAALGDRFPVTDLGRQFEPASFQDVAAVVKNLDLVVTVDTAIAHLAGALGVPVWIALPFSPDWRWLLDREDSPWYPTMRLFRQKRLGDWDAVFQHLAEELARLVVGRPVP